MTSVQFLAGARDFSLLHSVLTIQTSYRVQPILYRTGARGSFPVDKVIGPEVDPSPQAPAKIKNGENHTEILMKKMSKAYYAIRNMKHYMSISALKVIYYSFLTR
jgi:hypothetical protein